MITWSQRHSGSETSWEAVDDDLLVGQVMRYDKPDGWVAFRNGHRAEGGPWPTVDDAKAALERAMAT